MGNGVYITGGVEIAMAKTDKDKLHQAVADSRRARELREQGYREQALKTVTFTVLQLTHSC